MNKRSKVEINIAANLCKLFKRFRGLDLIIDLARNGYQYDKFIISPLELMKGLD